jgi:hypothetical protein
MSLDLRKPVQIKTRPDLKLFVRALDAIEELDLRDNVRKEDTVPRIVAAQLSAYVVDETGKQAFPTIDDAVTFMRSVRGGVAAKLANEGTKFNSLTDESVEEAEKKSEPDPSAESSSG